MSEWMYCIKTHMTEVFTTIHHHYYHLSSLSSSLSSLLELEVVRLPVVYVIVSKISWMSSTTSMSSSPVKHLCLLLNVKKTFSKTISLIGRILFFYESLLKCNDNDFIKASSSTGNFVFVFLFCRDKVKEKIWLS